MAFDWTYYGGDFGPQLKSAMLEVGRATDAMFSPALSIFDMRSVMIAMRDGDGSQASHYAEVAIRFATEGVDTAAKNAAAKKMFDELAALCGVIETTSSTRAQIVAAVDQATARLRATGT